MSRQQGSILRTLLIVASLISLILLTIAAVLLGVGRDPERPREAFFARSINDASYDCEDEIKDHFGDKLISKHFDQYSSRFDEDERNYLIYYRVTARDQEGSAILIREYMAKCVVWEKFGYVSQFQVFDDF